LEESRASRCIEHRREIACCARNGLAKPSGHVAMGLASSGRRCHCWMVHRNRLECLHTRAMALLVDLEMLGCLNRRAKDHAPQGKIDFYCVPHLIRPRVISI
jgi:hypothetical protein